MNELAVIFDKMDIETNEVLKAAGTNKENIPDIRNTRVVDIY